MQPSRTRWLSLLSLMKYTTGLEIFSIVTPTVPDGITASIVQGSSLGPAAYIVNAADLRPKHNELSECYRHYIVRS